MYGYIYLTTDTKTGKKYIGKHKATKFEFDKYKGSGLDIIKIFETEPERLVTTLMPVSDDVPVICETIEQLDNSERFYISYHNAVNSNEYYNRIDGGTGGDVYSQLPLEKQKLHNNRITKANIERWKNITPEQLAARSNKWRETYFSKSEEERKKLHDVCSEAVSNYYKNIDADKRNSWINKMKKSHAERIADGYREELRKQRERETKSKHTEEQKQQYREKQHTQQAGRHYYTDGTTIIKCKPEDAPEGFYLGGAHRNCYKTICEFDGTIFTGCVKLSEYLQQHGYPKMTCDRVREISNGKITKPIYKPLEGKIKIYDRKQYELEHPQ